MTKCMESVKKSHNQVWPGELVEQEREELMVAKQAGKYHLFDHVNAHPVGRLFSQGIRLRASHPAMMVQRSRAVAREKNQS